MNAIQCLIITAWQWLSFTYTPCIPMQIKANKRTLRNRFLALLLWEISHLSFPSRSCPGGFILIHSGTVEGGGVRGERGWLCPLGGTLPRPTTYLLASPVCSLWPTFKCLNVQNYEAYMNIEQGILCQIIAVHFLRKLKMELPFDLAIPLLGLYPKNPETPIQKNLCTPMFIAAQLTIR